MSFPRCTIRRALPVLLAAAIYLLTLPCASNNIDLGQKQHDAAATEKLARGEVLIDFEDCEGIKYVAGHILIDESPAQVWPIMVNPFEYERKICPRLKRVQVLTDQPFLSVLDCRYKVIFPIPDICYVVESKYTNSNTVSFRRLSGSLKDFRGYWKMTPHNNGTQTKVTYAMFVDPGVPVPEGIVRYAVRCELPAVLTGLRSRVTALKSPEAPKEKRTIQAASSYGLAYLGQ